MGQKSVRKRLFWQVAGKAMLRGAAAVHYTTEEEKVSTQRLLGLNHGKVIGLGIANGASTSGAKERLAIHFPELLEKPYMLVLSRLHPKKGLDVLLAAFALVAPALPRVTLVIAGNDAGSGYAEELKRLAAALEIGERCRFVGEVRGETKLDMLAGADAFVLPSHSEGLPVAAIEAMASALPVILSPGCNLQEVAAAGAGLIVEPSPEILSRAISSMFADPEAARAMGENGRWLVARKFTWPRIAGETLEIYRSLKDCRVARSA
jgi:glycosyltransferase involved in cell wall biosynthesis